MESIWFHSRISRILIAGLAGFLLATMVLEQPAHSRGAIQTAQPSSKVAVIPGIDPKPYPKTQGVPPLPVDSAELAPYHFTQLPPQEVTSAALSSYDTVFLYGIRWRDIPVAGQAAINAFAVKHKVVIWDADDTGPQTYTHFVHPFSTIASGEHSQSGASVVTFLSGTNFLASDDPSSPYYLDPHQLVNDAHMINHMNVMKPNNWVPALEAANHAIPDATPVLAWTYGYIGAHTGLVVYSGIDADGMADKLSPNYALKELALDLAAPFSQTPDSSCAPNCKPPPSGVGKPYAACSFARRVPRHWVRRRVPIFLKTSVAAGITGQVLTRRGRIVARGREGKTDVMRLVVRTRKLPSNRKSGLRAVVFVKGQPACSHRFGLKVDNVRPRFLRLVTQGGTAHLLSLSLSEPAALSIIGPQLHRRTVRISARKVYNLHFPASVRTARLILRDRAGNTLVRRLRW